MEVVGDEKDFPLAVRKEDEEVPVAASDASSLELVAVGEKLPTPGQRKFATFVCDS